jgi:AsmA protein
MAKPIKIIFGIFATLLLLVVVAAIALPLLFDANNLRGEIAKAAKDKTGRTLVIGNLHLSAFPWLKVKLDDLTFSNAPGFGETPMLTVKHAEAGVKLLPLLRDKRVEVDTVVLDGVHAELAVNEAGVSNWQDLVSKSDKPADDSQSGNEKDAKLSQFAVAGVKLTDFALHYRNQKAAQELTLDQANLSVGALGGGAAVPVEGAFHLNLAAQALDAKTTFKTLATLDDAAKTLKLADVELGLEATRAAAGDKAALTTLLGLSTAGIQVDQTANTLKIEPLALDIKTLRLGTEAAPTLTVSGSIKATPTLDLAARQHSLKGLLAELKLAGSSLPGGKPQALKLAADVAVDLAAQQARISQLQLDGLGLSASAKQWIVSNLSDAAKIDGDLTIASFSPRSLMATFGIAAPETTDPKVLNSVSLNTQIAASSKAANFSQMTLKLDETTLSGELGVRDFSTQALSFALQADRLDADRYLPPKVTAAAKPDADAKPAAKADANATEIPVQALDKLNAKGSLQVGTLKLNGLTFSNAQWSIDAPKGGRKHQQITANLYGGHGDITVDVTPTAKPSYELKVALNGINAAPLLKDLTGKEKVSGQGSVTLDLTSAGRTVGDVKQALNGDVAFNLVNGAVKGFNLAQIIRQGQALMQLNASEAANAAAGESKSTDFAELRGAGHFTNGVLKSDDLSAKNPLIRLSGAGEVNLVNETINYLAKPILVGTATGQGGKELSQLAGVEIPIRVSGNLYTPKVAIDWQAALQQQAAAKLREKLGLSEQEVRDKRTELRQKAKDEIGKQLFKLFGNKPAPAEPPPPSGN